MSRGGQGPKYTLINAGFGAKMTLHLPPPPTGNRLGQTRDVGDMRARGAGDLVAPFPGIASPLRLRTASRFWKASAGEVE